MRRNLIIAIIVAILCASIVYNNYRKSRASRLKPSPNVENSQLPQPSQPSQRSKVVLTLANDATAGKVVTEVQRLARPGRAAFAVSSGQSPRLACVLVEYPDRFFQLDLDMDAADFPALKEMNFAEPPDPLARTISRYKSVSKTAMDYDLDRGDRLIVLLCPAADWEKLKLECLKFSPPIQSSPGTQNKPQF